MVLQSTGEISMNDIRTEYPDTANREMSIQEFYNRAGFIGPGTQLSLKDFYGKANNRPFAFQDVPNLVCYVDGMTGPSDVYGGTTCQYVYTQYNYPWSMPLSKPGQYVNNVIGLMNNNYIKLSGMSDATIFTFVMVVSAYSTTSIQTLLRTSSPNATNNVTVYLGPTSSRSISANLNPYVVYLTPHLSLAYGEGTPTIIVMRASTVYTNGTNNYYLYFDTYNGGSQKFKANFTSDTRYGKLIPFSLSNIQIGPVKQGLVAFLRYDKFLNDVEEDKIVGRLAWLYSGNGDMLPVSHPYRSKEPMTP